MCLDDPNNSSAANTAIDIATCLNVARQYWTVPATGQAGQIRINGRCLDTASGSTARGAGVVLATCSTAPTQQWEQGPASALINLGATTAGHEVCLDDPSSSTTSGTPLDIAGCSGKQNQIWPLPAAPGPAAGPPNGPIFPQQTQTDTQQPCLDDANDSTAPGNKVQMWTCRGDRAQDWSVVTASPSGDTIKLGASSCLDTAGSNVVLNPCNGGNSQVWVQGAGDSLVQQSSGLCLDDTGSTRQRHGRDRPELRRRQQPGVAHPRLVRA